MTSNLRRVGLAAVATLLCSGSILAGGVTNAATAAPCAASDFSAKVTDSGAGMSQPYSFITLTNTSGSACTLYGYPVLTRAWSKKGKVAISENHRGIQPTPSSKPKKFIVEPAGEAWFAIGTATAYDPPLRNLTKIAVATTSGGTVQDSLTVKINQPATAPKGKPVPVSVTPFAPGVGKAS